MTNKNILFLLTGFLLISCSNVNTNSKNHFYTDRLLRHGVVPLPFNPRLTKGPKVKIDLVAAKRGKKVYKENCLACHGAKGFGDGVKANELGVLPKNLVKVVKDVPNFTFYMMASKWKNKMPGWKSVLSEKELKDVEHYIRKLASNN